MTCKELTERVMAFRDRELPLSTRLSLQFHAAMCPCCRNLLTSYDTLVEMSAELADVQVPNELAREFDDMILTAMRPPT